MGVCNSIRRHKLVKNENSYTKTEPSNTQTNTFCCKEMSISSSPKENMLLNVENIPVQAVSPNSILGNASFIYDCLDEESINEYSFSEDSKQNKELSDGEKEVCEAGSLSNISEVIICSPRSFDEKLENIIDTEQIQSEDLSEILENKYCDEKKVIRTYAKEAESDDMQPTFEYDQDVMNDLMSDDLSSTWSEHPDDFYEAKRSESQRNLIARIYQAKNQPPRQCSSESGDDTGSQYAEKPKTNLQLFDIIMTRSFSASKSSIFRSESPSSGNESPKRKSVTFRKPLCDSKAIDNFSQFQFYDDTSGCYLIYDPSYSGTLCTVWSHTYLSGACLHMRPKKRVPNSRFRENPSRIIGNIKGKRGKINLYDGINKFIALSKQFDGDICKISDWPEELEEIRIIFNTGRTLADIEENFYYNTIGLETVMTCAKCAGNNFNDSTKCVNEIMENGACLRLG